jgi:hypothetical protein
LLVWTHRLTTTSTTYPNNSKDLITISLINHDPYKSLLDHKLMIWSRYGTKRTLCVVLLPNHYSPCPLQVVPILVISPHTKLLYVQSHKQLTNTLCAHCVIPRRKGEATSPSQAQKISFQVPLNSLLCQEISYKATSPPFGFTVVNHPTFEGVVSVFVQLVYFHTHIHVFYSYIPPTLSLIWYFVSLSLHLTNSPN